MAGENGVTHGDLLLAIGNMQGKLDSLVLNMTEQRKEIADVFRRLGEAEKKIAQGVILAVVISLIMPILVMSIAPRISFPSHPQPGRMQ